MAKQQEQPKQPKFERVYREGLINGSEYYMRSAHRHPSCETPKQGGNKKK